MRSKEDFEKFCKLGRVRDFAARTTALHPLGSKIRVIGTKKSVDVDAAGYISRGMSVKALCNWLLLIRMVIE